MLVWNSYGIDDGRNFILPGLHEIPILSYISMFNIFKINSLFILNMLINIDNDKIGRT